MSIPIKKGIAGSDIPNIAVETSDSSIPRKPILVEAAPAPEPVIASLAATENGEYHAPAGIDGYNPILVNVEPHLTGLAVTENGTYMPESPFEGFSGVVVNVPPVEPAIKVASEFDFSLGEYDLIRSMPNEDPLKNALLTGYTYNANYDSTNEEVSWINGYGSWSPDFYLAPYKDYDIEVDLGYFDSSATLAGTKQIIALCKDGTNGLRFVWNSSNGFFQIINDSGTTNLPTLNDLSIINNAKILIKTRWSISTLTYEKVCNVSIILDREDPQSQEISFGRIDKDYAYELRVGRVTSQNGLYPYSIKYCRITEKKWVIE